MCVGTGFSVMAASPEHDITWFWLPPTLFHTVRDQDPGPGAGQSGRRVTCSGEADFLAVASSVGEVVQKVRDGCAADVRGCA